MITLRIISRARSFQLKQFFSCSRSGVLPIILILSVLVTSGRTATYGADGLSVGNINGVELNNNVVYDALTDTNPPVIVSAIGQKSLTAIWITFSEPILSSSATNPANYEVYQTFVPTNRLTIQSLPLVQGSIVKLKTTPRIPGLNYSLRVNGVQDIAAVPNQILPASERPLSYQVDLIAVDAQTQWRYFQGGTLPATNWNVPDFDDSSWSLGKAIFQAGSPKPLVSDPIRTVLSLKAGNNPITTYYFRTQFVPVGDLVPNSLQLHSVVDDGGVFYLNGSEVYSIGIPASRPMSYGTTASRYVGFANYEPALGASGWVISGAKILGTTNCFAAEVHQYVSGYTDVAFAANLEGTITRYYPQLRWTTPNVVLEGAGVLTNQAQVSILEPLGENMLLQLASSRPSDLTLPSQVTIPAGATNVTFDLMVSEDALHNGARTVTLTAEDLDGRSAIATLEIADNETNTITLIVEGSTTETNVNLPAEVRVAHPVSGDVNVALTSSLTSELTVPSSVVISNGAKSAFFSITVVNDRFLDGPQSVTLSASVLGWTSGSADVMVADDESNTISVQIPDCVVEGAGVMPKAGNIQLAGISISNLNVTLSSSAPGRVSVPSSLTLQAGQSNVWFNLTVPDNSVYEDAQTATISASISGFTSENKTLFVLENDAHHFAFGPISSPQYTNPPSAITLTALNVDGQPQTNFSGYANLVAIGQSGSVLLQPSKAGPFTNGIWKGPIQCLTTDRFVRLQTLDAPGSSEPFHVEGAPYRVVDLVAQDLIWDPIRQRIYASVPSTGGLYSNSIAALNPWTGAIDFSVPVGTDVNPQLRVTSGSGKMALSDDSQFLYISVNNAIAVQRVDLTARTAGPVFTVGNKPTGTPYSVADLVALEGAPNSVAVARTDGYNSRGVAIYDNGIQRVNTTPVVGAAQINVLEASPKSSMLLGYNNQNTGFEFSRIAVDASGASVMDATSGLLSGFRGDIVYKDGLVFGSGGGVVNPLIPSLVGQFKINAACSACSSVAPDPAIGRAFFLVESGSGVCLQAHDLGTFLPLKTFDLSLIGGMGKSILRWGTNGLAYISYEGKIWLIQSSLLFPKGLPANISVMQSNSTSNALAHSNLTITITVTNAGPEAAMDLTLTDTLPAGVTFISSTVSQGSCSNNAVDVVCNLGMLSVGSKATLTLVVRPNSGGWITNRAVALANELDSDLTNNISTSATFMSLPSGVDTVQQIKIPSSDLVYATNTGQLYISVPASAGPLGNSLISVDPITGEFGMPILTGENPQKLALSGDNHFLYVSTRSNQNVRRIDLLANMTGTEFSIDPANRNMALEDMAVLADQPESLVVLRTIYGNNADVAVFDSGVVRTNTAPTQSDGYTEILELADELPCAFVQNHGVGGLYRYKIDSTGVTLIDSDANLNPVLVWTDLEWGDGLLYTSQGLVIDPFADAAIGQIPAITTSSLVTYDKTAKRLYYLTPNGTTNIIRAIDPVTWALLGTLNVTNGAGLPSNLIRWGKDGLAFRTSADQLFILRSSIVPSDPPADLLLTVSLSTNLMAVNKDFSYTLVITNSGPNTASNVVVLHKLPTTVEYVSAVYSAGDLVFSNKMIRCPIGALTNGGSASIHITARTAVSGVIESVSSVVSDAVETNLRDNIVRLTAQSVFQLSPDSLGQIAIDVRDIAYNPFTGQLYVSGGGNQITIIDPNTGYAEASWPLPSRPGFLRLTDDGTKLYCTMNSGMDVARLDTCSGMLDFELPLGYSINDLEPMPGVPTTFVLCGGDSISIFDGTVSRPFYLSYGARMLDFEFGSTTNQIYGSGSAQSGGGLYRVMTILTNGIEDIAWNENVPYGLGPIKYDNGVMYASIGEVLDPSTGSHLGMFAGTGDNSLVEPDTDRQRVFFLNQSNNIWRLQAYEPLALAPLGSVTVSNVLGNPTTLLRWGDDGLAFCTTSNQLFLLRTALVPSESPADLALTQSVSPDPVMVGSNVTILVTVTNAGSNTASNVILLDRLPTNSIFISATASQSSPTQINGLVTCSLGNLASGASAQLKLTLAPVEAGSVQNLAAVTSDNLDPSIANNTSTLSIHAQMSLGVNNYGVIALNTADIAYEPISGILYAALTNYPGSSFENAIVSIDPATGLLVDLIPIGTRPLRLALTDDGSRLYVLAGNRTEFLRINLTNRLVELSVSGVSSRMDDIKSVPGLPESLLLTKMGAGVVVYDNDMPRPDTVLWFDQIEFYTANKLIGYTKNASPTSAARVVLTKDGLKTESGFVYSSIDGDMSASEGLIYTTSGSVFDPATLTKVSSFGIRGLVTPDSAVHRVGFLTGSGSTQTLRVFDTQNVMEWSTLDIPGIVGIPERLIRCGADRFAFRTSGGQVIIARSPAIPQGKPAELELGVNPTDLVTTAGQPVEFVFTVTNVGPNIASNITVTNQLPSEMKLIAATASHGTTFVEEGVLHWQLGNLGIGEMATNRIILIPGQAGLFADLAVLRSDAVETNSSDNRVRLTWTINNLATLPAISQLSMCASDLVWDPHSRQLFMSLPADAPKFSNSVISLDPASGVFHNPVPVGGDPGKLAVSDNGLYLYVGLNATASVARVRLDTRTVDLSFPLNNGNLVHDMRVIPGQPGTVAISRKYSSYYADGLSYSAGIALYQDGSELAQSIPSNGEFATCLACSTNSSRLYGYDNQRYVCRFRLFEVNINGVNLLSNTSNSDSGYQTRIEFDSGLVFASIGTVLEPEAHTVVTNIPDISEDALCKPDVALGLLSFLTQKSGNWYLRQYAHSNYALLREIRIPGVLGQPKSLTRWGMDGLAFLTSSNQAFFLRPALAIADLSIAHTAWPTQALTGQSMRISLTVSNRGSTFEPDSFVTNTIPSQSTLVAAQASQGTNMVIGNKVIFSLGELAPNATATLNLQLQAANATNVTFTNTAMFTGAFMEMTPSNNVSTILIKGLADTDRDGLPDDWELAHGLNSGNAMDAALDSDSDGLSNMQEYIAGTNPSERESVLRLNVVHDAGNHVTVSWTGISGRNYRVQSSTDMVHWENLTLLLSGSGATMSAGDSPSDTRFYRLSVETE